jgi:hypothetical protein
VSVSGYEELAEPTDASDITGSSLFTAEGTSTPDVHRRTRSNEENINGGHENISMDSLLLADMSTPKARHYKKPSMKQTETPYEKIQYQIQQQYRIDSSDASISRPTALDRYSALENSARSPHEIESPLSVKSLSSISHAQTSTPTSTPRAAPPSTIKRRLSPSKGPLLHRVLDNNWRLQATPFSAKRSIYADLDALSSPPAPEITSQIFSPSPMGKQLLKTPLPQRRKPDPMDNSDDEDYFEKELGMSPPVTMQFSMPASKLMKTPAKTAAMSIVEEVLRTAGAGKDVSMESLRTPGRLIGGRKLSSNASEKEMWDAIRAAGTGGSSGGRKRVDVNLDGSPFIHKTHDLETLMMGGVEDRSTLMTTALLANRDDHHQHTSQSLNDWQESEEWLA